MSDFSMALKYKRMSSARVMIKAEALQYDWRKGSNNPDKYFTVDKARDLAPIHGRVVVPSYTLIPRLMKRGTILFQYNLSLPSNFHILNLEELVPADNDVVNSGALYIKFVVGTTVYRYFMLGSQSGNMLSSELDYPAYEQQVIGKNCSFEFMYLGPTPADVSGITGINVDLNIKVSLTRLPSYVEEQSYIAGVPSLLTFDDSKFTIPITYPLNQALKLKYLDNTL